MFQCLFLSIKVPHSPKNRPTLQDMLILPNVYGTKVITELALNSTSVTVRISSG